MSDKDKNKDILYLISRSSNNYMAILLSNNPKFLNILDSNPQKNPFIMDKILHIIESVNWRESAPAYRINHGIWGWHPPTARQLFRSRPILSRGPTWRQIRVPHGREHRGGRCLPLGIRYRELQCASRDCCALKESRFESFRAEKRPRALQARLFPASPSAPVKGWLRAHGDQCFCAWAFSSARIRVCLRKLRLRAA